MRFHSFLIIAIIANKFINDLYVQLHKCKILFVAHRSAIHFVGNKQLLLINNMMNFNILKRKSALLHSALIRIVQICKTRKCHVTNENGNEN